MKQIIHRAAAITATLCVATFFSSTLLVELFGSIEAIRQVKSLIVFPGLFILVPAIALTGATGLSLAKQRSGRIINRKKKRMPFIAMNGVFILIPAAIFLNQWATEGYLDTPFYLLQAAELIAGAVNLVLMAMNIIDGKKFTHKKR
ncbi:hypothetical protein F9L16_04520 [Agarivorans sp. B2Z047]|uniref:hypothetical protein n=1 Tax=Agarivorans sp. B2Z047 TaxID=2652721 RepID=UPI00128D24EF|nr:hypothetical protein [Agarivorans sp. B2Z047]MPW28263.1 hypothetical protein [Agarivorans sp. B2Z047]UQN43909.1 hypothetical protein LQZ07_05420 [Agarivorans sp. B2Z047]